MLKWLDNIGYLPLIIFTIVMMLLPFKPMPHWFEKIFMLFQGKLVKPIDIFDLFFHSIPLILLIIKIVHDVKK